MLPIALSKRQIAIVGVLVVVVVGFFVLLRIGSKPGGSAGQIKLAFWGAESKKDFEGLLGAYKQFRPNVEITYTELPTGDLNEKLLTALAEGKGPDMVTIGSRDVDSLFTLLAPANTNQFSLAQFQAAFPTVAEQDFVRGGNAYAVPLFIDTLALFYNKDAFDQAGITAPPTTWGEFQELVLKLRRDSRAGAAIGGSEQSVRYAADLLELLIMQNGGRMTDASAGRAVFAREEKGIQAFQFYLQFSNAGSPLYTWNDAEEESIESFASGKSAMAFGYHGNIAEIKGRSPFLSFGVAAMPQVDMNRPIAHASYSGLAALKQGKNPQWAWDFMMFAAANAKGSAAYLDTTKRPPGFREAIAKAQNDASLGVFARQALIARSWQVPDDGKMKTILNDAVKNVLTGKLGSETALRQAEDQTTQLLGK
ncbi:MAG: extracellular solute-binding protein [Patescibacteria group bacterium]